MNTGPDRALTVPPYSLKPLLGYGAAAIGVAAAYGLRLLLSFAVGFGLPPFIIFYPAVMIVAVLAGMGPGLLATTLAALVTALWVLPMEGHPARAAAADALGLTLFVGMGGFVSAVAFYFHRSRQRAAAYQRELSLRESEQRFSTVFQASPIGMTITRFADGKYIDVNDAFLSLSGFSREEVIGTTALQLHTWMEPGEREVVVNLLRQRGVVRDRESRQRRKSREPWLARLSATVIDAAGEKCILTLLQDVTEEDRAEKALRESEARFRGTLDHMMEGCQIIGRDGRYLYVNDTACRDGMRRREELLGRTMEEAYPGIEGTPLFDVMRQCMEKNTSRQIENRFVYPDGTSAWFDTSIQPVTEGLFILSYDISERKRAEDEIRKLNAELEKRVEERTKEVSDLYLNAPCGYHSLDEKGTVIRVNDTELRMLGYAREEIIGRVNVRDLLTPKSRETFAESFPLFKKRGRIDNMELDFLRKDGSVLPVLLSGTAVSDEQGRFLMSRSTIIDNTEKKLLIEELQEAKHIAEEANQAKSSFLANMSHEIRTPMNAVIGFSNLALKTDLSPQQRDYVSKIQGAGVSLLGLINDILDFSKIEAGRLAIEQADFSLESVIERVTSFTSASAFSKGLELLVSVPPDIPTYLVGDAHRLGQILTNLVGNSVKFTDQGEVELRVALIELTGEKVKLRFSVRDTGIGMSEEHSLRLFQPFSQADSSTTRKFGGTGLGLSITRRLVELMGGQIWVQSAPAAGSTFTFTAWFGVGRKEHHRRPPMPLNLAGMRVLVVDDNPIARELMSDVLASLRFRVATANSGVDAIAAVRSADAHDPFGFVLMDWRMPELNGIEATRRILAPGDLRNAPVVVVLSASGGGEEERVSALAAGAADFLVKPVTPSTLVDSLLRIFAPELMPELKARVANEDTRRRVQGARILLVEDNEINQQIALELLRGEGAEVALANHGREALEKLSADHARYDIVLMDVQMPEMDGYEATRRIRAEPWGKEIPIIAMTAHALIEERQKALEAGMNDHISKPIDPEAMFATINRSFQPGGEPNEGVHGTGPAADEEVPFPRIEGIDIDDGLHRVAGNRGLLVDLLQRFADSQGDTAKKVDEALKQGDARLAERLAHTAKGSAGNLGMRDVEDAAKDLEYRIRNGSPRREVEESRRRLDVALATAVTRIREAIPARRMEKRAGQPVDSSRVNAVLSRLSTSVKGKRQRGGRALREGIGHPGGRISGAGAGGTSRQPAGVRLSPRPRKAASPPGRTGWKGRRRMTGMKRERKAADGPHRRRRA